MDRRVKQLSSFAKRGPREGPAPTFKRQSPVKALGEVPSGRAAVRLDAAPDADWLRGKPKPGEASAEDEG